MHSLEVCDVKRLTIQCMVRSILPSFELACIFEKLVPTIPKTLEAAESQSFGTNRLSWLLYISGSSTMTYPLLHTVQLFWVYF